MFVCGLVKQQPSNGTDGGDGGGGETAAASVRSVAWRLTLSCISGGDGGSGCGGATADHRRRRTTLHHIVRRQHHITAEGHCQLPPTPRGPLQVNIPFPLPPRPISSLPQLKFPVSVSPRCLSGLEAKSRRQGLRLAAVRPEGLFFCPNIF